MSSAWGAAFTALGEGAGDYGQLQHKGTIDALNDEAEMVKAQRLMALEESQLSTANMFKAATMDMGQQRLDISKAEAARAEEKYQHEKGLRGLGTWENKTIYPYGKMVSDQLGGAPTFVKGQGVEVQINSVTGEVRRLDVPGATPGGGGTTVQDWGGGTFRQYADSVRANWRIENPTLVGTKSEPDWGSSATDAEIRKMGESYKLSFTDDSETKATTTINPAGQDAGVPTLPPRKGSQDLQPYEWSKERLDYELKHFSQKKGTRKAVKKIISDVGESIDKVIEKLSVDNKEDNAFIARLLGTGADGIIYMVNQFAPGEEVFIETELGAVQWLMDNRGMTIADVVKWFKNTSLPVDDSIALGATDEMEDERLRRETLMVPDSERGAVLPAIPDAPSENFEISPEAKRMMEINEIPEAQGSAALATIAQAVGDPIEVITEAINSLPKDSPVIKIIRHWENQDLDEITSAIEMVKKQIAKIIPSTSDSIALGATDEMEEERFRRETAMIPDNERFIGGDVPQGLIAGDAPVPVGALGVEHPDEGMSEGLYVGPEVSGVSMGAAYPTVAQPIPAATLPLDHGQDDERIDDGPGLLDIKVALDPTQRSRRWDTSRGRQGEGGLSMDADYRTLPGTYSRAHGQDDPQEAGRLLRADIKAMIETAIMRPEKVTETDIFKMSYDESIQIIREVVDNLVKSGINNNDVINHLFKIVEGTSKSDEKKFNKSAYKKALQDTIIGLHTLNK